MKNILLTFVTAFGLIFFCISCNDSPTPSVEEVTFPLTYEFINIKDTTVLGGFDIRLGAYYPKSDSSLYNYTGLNNPAVGYQLKETFKNENMGYPGVKMIMVFSAMKVWPDDWPDREPLYQTLKWFYVEKRTVHDSAEATISFSWPEDTARTDVHEFDPDTTDGDFGFEGSTNGNFKKIFESIRAQ